jgi:hypothetical protein
MAIAVTLLDEAITDAVAAVTPDAPTYSLPGLNYESLSLQANFTYGSGGTTVKAWVQTTFDQGVTWTDIANFAFTTASARRLYHLTPVAVTSIATPTDGTLADNTAVNGLLGSNLRVKLTTTGTYAGGTSLVISALVR